MTSKDISELAQSYVDELFAHDDMQEQETIEAKNDALVMSMAFAGHILETHCIVPKEQVKEKYALCKMGYTECEGLELGFVMDALEDIFGKDMFEEEKE